MSDMADSQFVGDSPKWHPDTDLFGYLPFAKRLASAIVRAKSSQGMVLAVTGGWGVGKTTLLNFIVNELSNVQVAPYPAVIEFNPWWFSSKHDLAPQIVRSLKQKMAAFGNWNPDLGGALEKYADAIADTAEVAGGMIAKIAAKTVSTAIAGGSASVPSLKKDISKVLGGSSQKYVFVIDDIDRLSPDEISDLVRAVKALGDFPNVVYLMAFDSEIVSKALTTALSTDGAAYLEKVVQAMFAMPKIERKKLRNWLFRKLDGVIGDTDGALFDNGYWALVFFDGIDKLVGTPRDVVRLVDTLSVTYRAVVGEVNVVDFISLEVLRLFSPTSYKIVCENEELFAGSMPQEEAVIKSEKSFHDSWLSKASESSAVQAILAHIFPRFGKVMLGGHYWQSGPSNWRRHLRACSKETFPVYFQLGVPEALASRSLVRRLLLSAEESGDAAGVVLLESAVTNDLSGESRIQDLLDRMRDEDEPIPSKSVLGLAQAIFDVGDKVMRAHDETREPLFHVGPRIRLMWLVTRLVGELNPGSRVSILSSLFKKSVSISLMIDALAVIRPVVLESKGSSAEILVYGQFDRDDFEGLMSIFLSRLFDISENDFLQTPDLYIVLGRLHVWRERNAGRRIIAPFFLSQDRLEKLLVALVRYTKSQSGNDPIVKRVPRLDPSVLDAFFDEAWLDIQVEELKRDASLTNDGKRAVDAYFKARQRLRSGQSLDIDWDGA